ncbi:MAG: CinA family nicotinamide mononucleotide deamidase-related protein [Trueperaceae bacterium]
MSLIKSAELLAIGTELLLGETNDTNTAYLAGSLARDGVDVYWSQRVGDNLERVRHSIEQALSRSDLLVVTGGLGPTGDDLTREAIAAVFDEKPGVDPELEKDLRAWFARSGRKMPEGNLKQAWLIPSAQALPNPLGTAPGWLVQGTRGGKPRFLVALPGPPRELERMWTQEALPRLPLVPSRLHRLTLKTHGLGESSIAERLSDLTESSNPTVATYARNDGVHVRIATKAESAEEARGLTAFVEGLVLERLGEVVWGRDEDELPELVVKLLQQRGLTLATFEESTVGHLLGALSAVPGGQDSCKGAVVAWSLQTMAALGLPRPAASRVSRPEYAVSLAEAIRDTFAADVGVAVLENGSSDAGRQRQATDEAVIAVHAGGEPAALHLILPPLPVAWRRERITNRALHLLRSQLK